MLDDLLVSLSFSFVLFFIGFLGIILRSRNVLLILMCIELMLMSVNINLLIFSSALGDVIGQSFILFVFVVAAAEVAIGLSILLVYYRLNSGVDVEENTILKG